MSCLVFDFARPCGSCACAERSPVQLAGEVDQRLAGEEHGDRGDDAGRRRRDGRAPRRRHLRRGRRPFPCAPCHASRASVLRAEPLLKLVRSGHQPGAAALGLDPGARAISGRVGHRSRLSRSIAVPAERRRRWRAKISMPINPAASGPMNLASARTTPTASAVSGGQRADESAAANKPAGSASALPLAAAIALARPISARA